MFHNINFSLLLTIKSEKQKKPAQIDTEKNSPFNEQKMSDTIPLSIVFKTSKKNIQRAVIIQMWHYAINH